MITYRKILNDRLWVKLVALFFLYISVHPFLTAFVGSLTGVYAPIKIWKDIVVALIATIGLIFSITTRHRRTVVWSSNIVRIIAAYTLLTFIMFFYHQSYKDDSGYAGLIFNLRFIALFFAIYVFLKLKNIQRESIKKSFSDLKSLVLGIGTVVAFFGILQVTVLPVGIMQFFGYDGIYTISPVSTVDNNPNMRRAFSTLRGPNELGSFLILPLVIAAEYLISTRRKIYGVYLTIIASGIYFSHSRSAAIGAIVAISIVGLGYASKVFSQKTKIVLSAIILCTFLTMLILSTTYAPLRLIVFHSSPGDDSLIEGSTLDHFRATINGVKDASQHLLGRGVGEAGPASFYQTDSEPPRIAENYYVQLAQETSVAGTMLFVAVLAYLTCKMYRYGAAENTNLIASIAGLSVVAFFLHTWADDPTAYTMWGMMAITLAAGGKTNERTTNKKATRTT